MDQEKLIETLQNHECKVKASRDTITTTIDQMAHKELCQEPAFIRECFFEVLLSDGFFVDVNKVFDRIKPTAKNYYQL